MDKARAQEAGDRLVASHPREDPFAAAIKATRMAMLITDARQDDNPIIFCNDAFVTLTGFERDEVIGRNCRFLQGPETDPNAVAQLRDAIARKEPVRTDLLNYRKDGSPFWNALYISPVKDETGEPLYYFASQLDVTSTKEKESDLERARDEQERVVRERTAELRAALEAKTVLLHEVDHRVKNNLLTIASLVKLQARRTTDETARAALQAVLGRVEALSLVQRKLFVLDDLSRFDVAEFARDMVADLLRAARRDDIAMSLDLSPVHVPAAKAAPIALIVHELIADAIAHTRRVGGRIGFSIERRPDSAVIRLIDNGIGRQGQELGPDAFGRLVVESSASQLGATVRWSEVDGGVAAEVTLPCDGLGGDA